MKKFLSMLVALTLVLSALAIVPVQATIYREVDIAEGKTPVAFYGGGATQYEDNYYISGYDVTKMTDGDDSTYAIIKRTGNSGHMVYVDLGSPQDISSIRLKTTAATVANVVQNENSSLSTASASMNSNMMVFVSNDLPQGSYFSGATTTSDKIYVVKNAKQDGTDVTFDTLEDGSTAIGTQQYVGIWVPYSYGMAINTLEVNTNVEVPADEVEIVSKNVALGATTTSTTAYSTYTKGNAVDGSTDTIFMAGKVTTDTANPNYSTSNNYLWIDLGQAYEITKIVVKMPDAATRTTMFGNSGSQNQNNFLQLCDFGPGEYTPSSAHFTNADGLVSSNIPDGKSTLFASKQYDDDTGDLVTVLNWQNMTEFVWEAEMAGDASTTYQYILLGGLYSSGLCISEIEVYADVEVLIEPEPEVPTITVNKDILAGKTGIAKHNDVALTDDQYHTGYGLDKITDSDDDTFGIVKFDGGNSGYLLMYDLGEATEITKIRVKTPATDAAQSASGISSTFNANGSIFVADSLPTWTNLSTLTSSVTTVEDITRLNAGYSSLAAVDKTFSSPGTHRYVGIFMPYSSGIAVSSFEVWADVEEEVVGESVLVSRNKAVFATGDTIGDDSTYAEMNIVDGNPETVYASKAYSETYQSENSVYNEQTAHFYRDFDVVIDLGAQIPVSKIEFTPYNLNTGSEDIAYTISGTNDYAATSGMTDPILTTLATYTGPADNVKVTAYSLSGSYRFIVVNVKNSDTDASAVTAGIRDIDVYGNDNSNIADVDTRMVRISRDKTVITTNAPIEKWGLTSTDAKIASDGYYSTGVIFIPATSGASNYYIVDLGKAYPIAAINFQEINGSSGFHTTDAIQVVATNDNVTQDTAANANWTTIATGDFKTNAETRPMYAVIDDATSYRYVAIKGVSGVDMPMRQFDVWTTAEAASEVDVLRYTIAANGTDITYEMSAENAPEGTYNVIVASYDSNGVLIKVDTSTTISTSAGSADIVDNKISGSITGAADANATEVKVFVMNLSNLRPLTTTVRAN